MNAAPLHPLARDYLKRLKKAAAILPRPRRKELIEEIESHLREALPAGASEAEALIVLDRLGEPGEIVAEAWTGQAPASMALNERVAVPLLLFGGFLFGVGWVVGVVLLWSSTVWTLRDKLIGTLVLPGGLATTAFVFLFAAAGTGGGGSGDCVVHSVTRVGLHGAKAVNTAHECASSGGNVNYLALVLVGGLLVVLPVLTSIYLSRRAKRLSAAMS